MSAKFQENLKFVKPYHIENGNKRENSIDPDEVAHYDLLHLNLYCLQNQVTDRAWFVRLYGEIIPEL